MAQNGLFGVLNLRLEKCEPNSVTLCRAIGTKDEHLCSAKKLQRTCAGSSDF